MTAVLAGHGSAATSSDAPESAEDVLLLRAARRADAATVREAFAFLLFQLEVDAAAMRSALAGPDPEYAARVLVTLRATLDENTVAAADRLSVKRL